MGNKRTLRNKLHQTQIKRFVKAATKPKKGAPSRNIIRTKTVGDRVYSLHATKGWRSTRAA